MIKDSSYLCDLSDLLCDVLGAVFYLAGCDDFNLCGRRRSHPIWAEGEGNLRDSADGPVSHQIRVWRGVQSAGLQIYSTEQQHQRLRLKNRETRKRYQWLCDVEKRNKNRINTKTWRLIRMMICFFLNWYELQLKLFKMFLFIHCFWLSTG